MDTLLMTGGTGFIGHHLVPDLLAAGWRVEVLTRDKHRAQRSVPEQAVLIESLAAASAPKAVINLAGENLAQGRWTAARKREMYASRQRVTHAVLDFMRRLATPPSVLISASAVGFYGSGYGSTELDESAAAGDEYQSQLCVDWERAAWRASDELNIRVGLIRTGIVLGRGGGTLAQMLMPFKLGVGGRFGNARQYMPWIHIRDQVRAIAFLLNQATCSGPFNLTAPHPMTNAAFSKALAQVLHRSARMRMPASVLNVLLGEMAHLVLTGQRAVPKRLQEAGFVFEFPKLDAALENVLGRSRPMA
jgi:uncharacterized protein (TIGR01777 family)